MCVCVCTCMYMCVYVCTYITMYVCACVYVIYVHSEKSMNKCIYQRICVRLSRKCEYIHLFDTLFYKNFICGAFHINLP